MIRAVLVVVIALFSLSFTPVSNAQPADESDGVVWGT